METLIISHLFFPTQNWLCSIKSRLKTLFLVFKTNIKKQADRVSWPHFSSSEFSQDWLPQGEQSSGTAAPSKAGRKTWLPAVIHRCVSFLKCCFPLSCELGTIVSACYQNKRSESSNCTCQSSVKNEITTRVCWEMSQRLPGFQHNFSSTTVACLPFIQYLYKPRCLPLKWWHLYANTASSLMVTKWTKRNTSTNWGLFLITWKAHLLCMSSKIALKQMVILTFSCCTIERSEVYFCFLKYTWHYQNIPFSVSHPIHICALCLKNS